MQLFNTRGKEKQLTGGYAMQTRILDCKAQLYASAEFSPKMKKKNPHMKHPSMPKGNKLPSQKHDEVIKTKLKMINTCIYI